MLFKHLLGQERIGGWGWDGGPLVINTARVGRYYQIAGNAHVMHVMQLCITGRFIRKQQSAITLHYSTV